MSKLIIFPLGNADCSLILTDSNKLILIDYANMRVENSDDDRRADLEKELKDKLYELERDYIDVVVFTHLDEDHYKGFSDVFYLMHSTEYQSVERIKVKELWVPAGMVVERGGQVKDEAKILRAEARYRLKNKKDIKVFSKPEMLGEWLEENDLSQIEVAKHIVDAGAVINGFTLENDGIEIFPHAPFAADFDDIPGYEINRNDSALVLHVTFLVSEDKDVKIIFGSDPASGVWEDIIKVTEHYNNENYLEWDIIKIPHHSSYRSLNENKEEWEETYTPVEKVKRLYEKYSREGCLLISTSESLNSDSDQPPHKEALNYYKEVAESKSGKFIITMEHPTKETPKALEIDINDLGYKIVNKSTVITTNKIPNFIPKGLYGESV